tara:strand:- start:111 stop:260 length:150 start_codon:yes stop_codon:yes gene_type:complete
VHHLALVQQLLVAHFDERRRQFQVSVLSKAGVLKVLHRQSWLRAKSKTL